MTAISSSRSSSSSSGRPLPRACSKRELQQLDQRRPVAALAGSARRRPAAPRGGWGSPCRMACQYTAACSGSPSRSRYSSASSVSTRQAEAGVGRCAPAASRAARPAGPSPAGRRTARPGAATPARPGGSMADDLLVDAQRLRQVLAVALGQLGPLEQEVHLLFAASRRLGHPLPVVEIQVGQAAGAVQHLLHQVGRLGVAGHRGQRLAQGRHRVVDVARLVPAAGDLVVDGGRPLLAVVAQPARVGVDGGQRLQRPVVARAQAHHLAQALGRPLQIAQLLAQHPAQAQQQVAAPLGLRGQRPAPARTAAPRSGSRPAPGRSCAPTRPASAPRASPRPAAARPTGRRPAPAWRSSPWQNRPSSVASSAMRAGSLLCADRRRLHLQHGHVFGRAALLPVHAASAGGPPWRFRGRGRWRGPGRPRRPRRRPGGRGGSRPPGRTARWPWGASVSAWARSS